VTTTPPVSPWHPEHPVQREAAPGVWVPAIPEEPASLLLRWRLRRECRKRGGHFWHPTDPMIGWGCCVCGKPTEGMPYDGTSR
jgi:hypothetical protein